MTSRLRTTSIAAATGILMLGGLGIAAPAPAADYPPAPKPVSCKVSTNAARAVLKVNMGPNLKGNRYYTFQIQRLKKGAWTNYGKVLKTKGKKETRTVNVPKGTYQVLCFGKYGRTDATSKTIKIKK